MLLGNSLANGEAFLEACQAFVARAKESGITVGFIMPFARKDIRYGFQLRNFYIFFCLFFSVDIFLICY